MSANIISIGDHTPSDSYFTWGRLGQGLLGISTTPIRRDRSSHLRPENRSVLTSQLDLLLNQPKSTSSSKRRHLRRRRAAIERATIAARSTNIVQRRSFRDYIGAWSSGDARSADNDRIDRDLARAYSNTDED